ncbi:ketosynthase chain-length factor [Streptomyces violaceorubidus]
MAGPVAGAVPKFALSATQHALADARFGRADVASPYSVGVVTAAGSGGGEFGQRELQNLWGQGSRHVGPYQSIAWFYAASTGQVSIRNGFKGPCGVVAADEAGGLDALAHAALAVRNGTDTVVCGATEAPLAPYSIVCQLGYPELSRSARTRPCLPPVHRSGLRVRAGRGRCRTRRGGRGGGPGARGGRAGDGGRARGDLHRARPLGRVPGRAGPRHPGRPGRGGLPARGRRRGLRGHPRGSGGRRGPRHWPWPTRWARTPRGCRSTAPSRGTGRAYCAAPVLDSGDGGARDGARAGPAPTPHVFEVCHDLDLVTGRARPAEPRTALVLARGLMGSNSALVLRRGAVPAEGR